MRTRLSGLAIVAGSALGFGMSLINTVMAQTGQQLVGTWEWVSVDNTMPDGGKTQPFGPKPAGYLSFDGEGRFFWLITRPGRPKFASGRRDQGTPDENKATVQGSLAYCGRYAVSGDTLVLKIEASTYPNEEGNEQRRTFHLNGDELTWHNPVVSTGAKGMAVLKRTK